VFHNERYSSLIIKEMKAKISRCNTVVYGDNLLPPDSSSDPRTVSRDLRTYSNNYISRELSDANLPDVSKTRHKSPEKCLAFSFLVEDLFLRTNIDESKVLAYTLVDLNLSDYIYDYISLPESASADLEHFKSIGVVYIHHLIKYIGSSRRTYKAKSSLKRLFSDEFFTILNSF
jgi:hypothetical protein